ncbi:MAG TPA: GDSL-type esterase/lipase family protein [Sphingobacteriaceae bacterium]|nr:GDSL-type esterase/lipase family protein [Sphingobacteriaceae bacterium]
MKKSYALLLLASVVLIFSAMKLNAPQKIIFFGDSITELGIKPGGYISLLQDQLQQKGKPDSFELIGAGISANKVYDLYLRLEKDVLSKKPQTVVIWIGVNDVWHKRTHGTGTDANKFIQFYSAIIEKIQSAGIKVILCTPTAIGEKTDHSNEQDGDLNQYSTIIRSLAAKYNTGLCDLRKLFLQYNVIHNPGNKESGILTTDRVHLNVAGNKLVADAFSDILFR